MEYQSKKVKLQDWNITLVLDEDNHLGVFIGNDNDDSIVPCDADIGAESEWAERFTTNKIEDAYKSENS